MKHLATILLGLVPCFITAQELQKITIPARGAQAITYSPDTKYFIISKGNTAQLFNSGNDTKIKDLNGGAFNHTREILDAVFSNNATMVATASADKSVKLWKIPEGTLLHTFDGLPAGVLAVRFIDNDRFVVAIAEDGTLNLWDVASHNLVYSKKDFSKEVRAMDASPEGKYIAVAGGDDTILLYEASAGNIVRKISGHTNWVRALAFSPDGKTLASGGDDKVINLWEVESGNKLQSFQTKGWIYDLEFSLDGKYLAAALEKYAVHFYNVSTGLIALKLDNFKGSVLRMSINSNGKEIATTEQYGSNVRIWSIESLAIAPALRLRDSKDKMAPLIMVSNPPNIVENKVRVYTDLIDVRGVVTDESGIRSLRVNGIETPIRDNGNFVINLPLYFGDNYVTMEVTDVNDNIALKKFIITRKNAEGEQYNPALAKNFLLVVGINSYQYWPKLNNAVKDVDDLVTILMEKYNYQFSNVTVLKDEQATRANLINAMRNLISKISAQDNLLIYFSGHGYFDEILNEGYWIPVEAHTNSSGEYISNSEILKIISNVNSQHTFLVADACFSGALFADSKRGYTDQVEKFRSRWGLASGRLEVVSDGSAGDTNSPFAKRFIQFLQENEKDKFAVSELVQFVKTQVAEDTNQTPIGNPLKALGDEGGEMVFYKKKQ